MDKMYYNPETKGFEDKPIEGWIQVSREYWQELLDGQSQGMQLMSDENGYPLLIEPDMPTQQELVKYEIAQLKTKLSSTDWAVTKCVELELSFTDTYPEYATERSELRAKINLLESQMKS